MDIQLLRSFLLWCTAFKYAVLIAGLLALVKAHDWILRFHGRWFYLTGERFDALHYAGMSVYKIAILLLNLAPLAASYLV